MLTELSRKQSVTHMMTNEAALGEYATLKARVRETLVLGQQRIEAAKVVTYWRTGWYIQTHIRLRSSRSERYGTQVLERLARDLDMDVSGLRRCVRFAERLPRLFDSEKIQAARPESLQLLVPSLDDPKAHLTWTHYRALLTVPNERRREALLQEAARKEWSATELEIRIRRQAARSNKDGAAQPSRLITPLRGTVGLFQIKDLDGLPARGNLPRQAGTRYWDLGFESYRELSTTQAHAFKAGDLVRLTADGELEKAPDAKPAALYTYEAQLLRVVDGDTLWLLIRLGGADWRKEKLRLRGIDCPELGTAAGEAAKRYVQSQIQRTERILLTTTKPDQWDRYLSDVFLMTTTGEDIFLNNRLLETGHARRYEAVSPSDWDARP